jgi:hypothetical protein
MRSRGQPGIEHPWMSSITAAELYFCHGDPSSSSYSVCRLNCQPHGNHIASRQAEGLKPRSILEVDVLELLRAVYRLDRQSKGMRTSLCEEPLLLLGDTADDPDVDQPERLGECRMQILAFAVTSFCRRPGSVRNAFARLCCRMAWSRVRGGDFRRVDVPSAADPVQHGVVRRARDIANRPGHTEQRSQYHDERNPPCRKSPIQPCRARTSQRFLRDRAASEQPSSRLCCDRRVRHFSTATAAELALRKE